MTTREFSDMFDTLLNSFNHKAEFGDLSSYADVSLDEYEKSVFLTLAQDTIIKSYFDARANTVGLGFDDSVRRLADFSALISINTPTAVTGNTLIWVPGVTYYNGVKNTITGNGTSLTGYVLRIHLASSVSTPVVVLTVLGVKYCDLYLGASTVPSTFLSTNSSTITSLFGIPLLNSDATAALYIGILSSTTAIATLAEIVITSYYTSADAAYDDRGVLYAMPLNILLMLNEKYKVGNKNYVVVPISYLEYDRLMSKAYALPLKKLAWRLFLGLSSTGLSISEIIPIEGVSGGTYKIRYIRRPRPIVLTNLSFNSSLEPLNIDGYTEVTECELAPILHMDVLNEAVRLALNSAGIETRDLKAAREALKNRL